MHHPGRGQHPTPAAEQYTWQRTEQPPRSRTHPSSRTSTKPRSTRTGLQSQGTYKDPTPATARSPLKTPQPTALLAPGQAWPPSSAVLAAKGILQRLTCSPASPTARSRVAMPRSARSAGSQSAAPHARGAGRRGAGSPDSKSRVLGIRGWHGLEHSGVARARASSSATLHRPSAAKRTEPPTISLLIHLGESRSPSLWTWEIMRQEAVTPARTFITADG